MDISVIVPTLNEEENISILVPHLKRCLKGLKYEIIIADGCSSDRTVRLAQEQNATVVSCSQMSRANQMNKGAKIAKGELLYFVHADTLPPQNFMEDIKQALNDGFVAGCFRFRFNSKRFLLAINSYCTRFKGMLFRGGDQSLFIKKQNFIEVGGFIDNYRIMEDYDIIQRVRKRYQFKIIANPILVSTRIYNENSYLKVTFVQLTIFLLYKFGVSQEYMIKTYDKLIKHPKAESLK